VAEPTLAVISPQDFHTTLGGILDRYVEQVSPIVDQVPLGICSYEYPETSCGACDGEPCCDPATVHDLDSDLGYCTKHFRYVSLQRALEALRG
jgi:hypothetical protein